MKKFWNWMEKKKYSFIGNNIGEFHFEDNWLLHRKENGDMDCISIPKQMLVGYKIEYLFWKNKDNKSFNNFLNKLDKLIIEDSILTLLEFQYLGE